MGPTCGPSIYCFPFFPVSGAFVALRALTANGFLLAVACGRRCSELHALSILPQHMRITAEGATLLPRAGFLAKNQTFSFTPEPIFLPALCRATGNPEDAPWCPVQCLRAYLKRTKARRGKIDQLFVTSCGQAKALSKTALSRWLVALVKRAYRELRLPAPQSLRAHDTRGQSASWALYAGVPVSEIIANAGWSTATTFQHVYLKDVLIAKETRASRAAVAALRAGRRC